MPISWRMKAFSQCRLLFLQKKKISRLNEALKQESNMLEKERSEKDVEVNLYF